MSLNKSISPENVKPWATLAFNTTKISVDIFIGVTWAGGGGGEYPSPKNFFNIANFFVT
jgi:hypothetical protein